MNTKENLHTSVAARKRVKKRYRVQARLKLAGMAAIALAALALATLLFSITQRAIPAFTETYITLDIFLDGKRIDPDGTRSRKTLYSANYSKLIKNALKEEFPGLGRREKRQLNRLVSDASAYELRDHVVASPDLIGTRIKFDLLADDGADLFAKGISARVEDLAVRGDISVAGGRGPGDDIVLASGSGAFNPGLDIIKKALITRATILDRQADNQRRAVEVLTLKISTSNDATKGKKLTAQRQVFEKKLQTLAARIFDLRTRAARLGGMEKIDESLPSLFIEISGGVVKLVEISPNEAKGIVVLPLDQGPPSQWSFKLVSIPESNRNISDRQIIWLQCLEKNNRIKRTFAWHFFTSADASEPEEAGILGGLLGTFWTMLVTFLLAFPVGVFGAIYLEEFAPKNIITTSIEVMINNLAAIPSIVFGLLGLAVFVNIFGLPYSTSLVGGIVLALMTLPTVIIASRAAIKAVPLSIREAALAIGASRMQMVFQHVLPLAMPGIMTGSILGMAQALGETAPLLMIGMVAFIVDPPTAVTDAASSLPVLIYLWSDRAEAAFDMKTAAAILVLLGFLITMNALAILLRKKFERRW